MGALRGNGPLGSCFGAILLIVAMGQAQDQTGRMKPADVVREAGKPYTERIAAPRAFVERFEASENEVAIEMVYIPAGKYVMGAKAGENDSDKAELPAHEVAISGFWMSKYEVSWDVFQLWSVSVFFVDSTEPLEKDPRFAAAGKLPRPHTFSPYGGSTHDTQLNYPVTDITQYGAQNICRWLSVRTGRRYRLPTEAEWEYAARVGRGSAYFFGDDPSHLSDYAWFGEPKKAGPHPVGRKKPNPWGLYDIYGNVAEWTLDGWSSDYTALARQGRVDPWVPRAEGMRWAVARGGDWTSKAGELRSAARRKEDQKLYVAEFSPRWYNPTEPGGRVGFRLVAPEKEEQDHRETSVHALPEKGIAPYDPPEEEELRESVTPEGE